MCHCTVFLPLTQVGYMAVLDAAGGSRVHFCLIIHIIIINFIFYPVCQNLICF